MSGIRAVAMECGRSEQILDIFLEVELPGICWWIGCRRVSERKEVQTLPWLFSLSIETPDGGEKSGVNQEIRRNQEKSVIQMELLRRQLGTRVGLELLGVVSG